MRHRQAGRHLGRDTAHRKALYRNLVTDLLRYERITTTEAKAKEIRPIAEKIITLGKRGDVHARRQALRYIYDKHVVERIFDDIGPRMADRPGGYLRITALEPRKGDGALMASIELIDYLDPGSPVAVAAAPRATAPPSPATSAVAPPVGEAQATTATAAADAAEPATTDVAEDEAPADAPNESDAEVEEETPTAEAEDTAEASIEESAEEEDDKDGAS
ncbi:MAG: 50S ribosomal protein L17 [Dehalococcoidia bacterium]|nr:50S ribosomal protein L17 [Dehalococcoidia bacterium]